jgi:hypothetical protein
LILAVLLAAAVAPPRPVAVFERVEYAQIIVRSHIVIRVQTAPSAPPIQTQFREKKGPRCVPLTGLAGSAVIAPNSVDLALRDGRRVRARFSASCPGLDYYSGFYLVPHPDGMLCAGRDVVRDRAGGECPVEHIRRLEAAH